MEKEKILFSGFFIIFTYYLVNRRKFYNKINNKQENIKDTDNVEDNVVDNVEDNVEDKFENNELSIDEIDNAIILTDDEEEIILYNNKKIYYIKEKNNVDDEYTTKYIEGYNDGLFSLKKILNLFKFY